MAPVKGPCPEAIKGPGSLRCLRGLGMGSVKPLGAARNPSNNTITMCHGSVEENPPALGPEANSTSTRLPKAPGPRRPRDQAL